MREHALVQVKQRLSVSARAPSRLARIGQRCVHGHARVCICTHSTRRYEAKAVVEKDEEKKVVVAVAAAAGAVVKLVVVVVVIVGME